MTQFVKKLSSFGGICTFSSYETNKLVHLLKFFVPSHRRCSIDGTTKPQNMLETFPLTVSADRPSFSLLSNDPRHYSTIQNQSALLSRGTYTRNLTPPITPEEFPKA